MKPWIRIKSEPLLRDRWLTLRADECQLPSGKRLKPYYVLEEKDWVHVFAIAADGRVLTVKHPRRKGTPEPQRSKDLKPSSG